jgi:hypothetical protein
MRVAATVAVGGALVMTGAVLTAGGGLPNTSKKNPAT